MICFPCLVVGLFSQDFIGGTQQRDPIGLKHVDAAHLWELFFFPKNSQHIIARSYESPYIYNYGIDIKRFSLILFLKSHNLS